MFITTLPYVSDEKIKFLCECEWVSNLWYGIRTTKFGSKPDRFFQFLYYKKAYPPVRPCSLPCMFSLPVKNTHIVRWGVWMNQNGTFTACRTLLGYARGFGFTRHGNQSCGSGSGSVFLTWLIRIKSRFIVWQRNFFYYFWKIFQKDILLQKTKWL